MERHQKLRIGLYGTAHSHAPGKLRALRESGEVEVVGVCEPDAALRERARRNAAYEGVTWLDAPEDLLEDPAVEAVCIEGDEGKCSQNALRTVQAGKHIWYDKPAGDWTVFQAIIETAREKRLQVQMGYMLRYVGAFRRVGEWVREGTLGEVFKVRGNMSAFRDEASRRRADYRGGVAFELAPHMIDQMVWLFGGAGGGTGASARPEKVTSFLRNDATPDLPGYTDNSLVVLEFERGLGMIDSAAVEPSPQARRFEVYGTKGSATVLEPFEPGARIRLVLDGDRDGHKKGEQLVEVEPTPRSISFPAELAAFVAAVRGKAPDRSLDHELLVEETLHRAMGTL